MAEQWPYVFHVSSFGTKAERLKIINVIGKAVTTTTLVVGMEQNSTLYLHKVRSVMKHRVWLVDYSQLGVSVQILLPTNFNLAKLTDMGIEIEATK